MVFAMTTQATRINVLFRHRFEADDFGDVPTARHVRRSRTVTRFATVPVIQRSFEMRGELELLLVEVFVTAFTNIAANILRWLVLWRRDAFLCRSNGWPDRQQQHDCRRTTHQLLNKYFSRLHSRTPCSQRKRSPRQATAATAHEAAKVNLLKRLDVVRNRLRLILCQPGDALVVGRLARRLALGEVLHNLIGLESCSFQCRRLYA